MKSKPDVDITGSLSSVSDEQGAQSSSCWKQMSSLPPFLVPKAPAAHLEFVWYNQFPGRRWSKKSQLPLPVHFPFPQLSGPSLFSNHVTALCHSSPVYKQGRLLKCHCEKAVASLVYTSAFSIQLRRASFLFLGSHKQSWRNICKPKLRCNWKKKIVRVFNSGRELEWLWLYNLQRDITHVVVTGHRMLD